MTGSHRLLAALVLLAVATAAPADNWPQWRGPTSDGISKEKNVPAQWSDTMNLAWKLRMPGQSGATPAVWGDRIFVPSADGNDLVLLCVNTEGKLLWKRPLGSGDKAFMRGEGNNASPSPSTDGKHVWAYAGTGDLACFDFDGNVVWKFNAQDRYGKFSIWHGMHITPLLSGDRLYLSLLHSNAHWVIALDKATGKEIWKVERKSDAVQENEHSYASPVLWANGKDAYLVIHGNDYTTAHRLEDGKEIWRLGGLNPKEKYNGYLRFVATPLATPDLIVVPSAKGGPVVGVKPDAQGAFAAGSPHEQWRRPKDTPDVASPLVYDGLLYLCRENGLLICMDVKTGKELYNHRLHGATYRASPVYADGKVYCVARDGVTSVVKAGPTFELVAENRLPDDIAASVVVADGRIYLRGFKHLYAIGPAAK